MADEFEFDKFIKDITKREEHAKAKRQEHQESFRDHPIRKLNILTRELWQNRIKWRR
jgi:hypothetical protein